MALGTSFGGHERSTVLGETDDWQEVQQSDGQVVEVGPDRNEQYDS